MILGLLSDGFVYVFPRGNEGRYHPQYDSRQEAVGKLVRKEYIKLRKHKRDRTRK